MKPGSNVAERRYRIHVKRNTLTVEGKRLIATTVFAFRIIEGESSKLIATKVYTRECVCGQPNCLGQKAT